MKRATSLADVAAKMPTDEEEATDDAALSDDDDEGAEYDAAAGELADVLGVGGDKIDAFKEALKAVVMTCK